MSDDFREIIGGAPPILMREPLAEFLGAFRDNDNTLSYTLADAVKLAGHCCPTVTGAYLATRRALSVLYGDEVPVRGEISVTALGRPDEGVYGVMSQVMAYITGAAPETGFKGLVPRFRRQGLLNFSDGDAGDAAVSFRFLRQDGNGSALLVRILPWLVPLPEDRARRSAELMEKVRGGGADEAETVEFRDLWMEKIKGMLQSPEPVEWLQVQKA